jgi:hypothetical protein
MGYTEPNGEKGMSKLRMLSELLWAMPLEACFCLDARDGACCRNASSCFHTATICKAKSCWAMADWSTRMFKPGLLCFYTGMRASSSCLVLPLKKNI